MFIIGQEVLCSLLPEDSSHSGWKVPLAQCSWEQSHAVSSQGQRFPSLCSPRILAARPDRCVPSQSQLDLTALFSPPLFTHSLVQCDSCCNDGMGRVFTETKTYCLCKAHIVGLGACLCCSRVFSGCQLCRINLILKGCRDLLTILIKCTCCVPLAALTLSICLLETSGKGIKNAAKQRWMEMLTSSSPVP